MLNNISWMLPARMEEPSLLLNLPAELRQRIFEFALVSDKPLVTFLVDDYQREIYEEARQPPLLRTSRQIRGETLPLYYSCNDFIFFTEGKKADEGCKWLRQVQSYVDSLGGVTLWLRYLRRPQNNNVGPLGAISITMHYDPRHRRWTASRDWRWISPLRKPEDAADDGRFLIDMSQHMVDAYAGPLGAESLESLWNNLRKSYIDHKIHRQSQHLS